MIKKFGKEGYKQIKKLVEKLEKKKEILREKEALLVLEKERNLSLEESLAKEKDKVEKLTTDLSLANDSNVRMSKDHALAKDSLASLTNVHSELQERHSRLEDINKDLEVSYSTLWESTKSSSKANLDSNASTSKGCSKCYNHDINACVTNLSKLEEAIKSKDDQIYKLVRETSSQRVTLSHTRRMTRLEGFQALVMDLALQEETR